MQNENNNKQPCSDPSLRLKNLSNSQLLTNAHLKAMPLFPTMGSLQEVIDMADSQLPITNKNDISALLFTYHNTLLAHLPTSI